MSFLSKIRTTLENLWGGNPQSTQATLSPVNVAKQLPADATSQPESAQLVPQQGQPLPVDPQIDQSRQAAVDGLVAQGITDPKTILTLLNGQSGKNKGDFTLLEVQQRLAQQPSETPNPQPTAAPGIDNAMQFIQGQMPPSSNQTPQEYYPALQDEGFMGGIMDADKLRQGMAGLLLLQGFFESTLGRAGNGNNIFGALPPGGASFQTPVESLNYQTSPAVLGGGANPNMNILAQEAPLTPQDVTGLYDSYNPNSQYLEQLLQALFPQGR